MLSSSSVRGADSAAEVLTPARSGFARVDELASDPLTSGVYVVHTAASILETVARHAERRALRAGRRVIRVAGLAFDDAWRELGSRLGVEACVDPVVAASRMASAAGDALLIVHEGHPTAWGDAVADELSRILGSSGGPLVFAMAEGAHGRGDLPRIAVNARTSREEISLWWYAIAEEEEASLPARGERLDSIEAWWLAARSTPSESRMHPPSVSPEGTRLLARFAASERTWTLADAAHLESAVAVNELVLAGFLVVDPHGRLIPTHPLTSGGIPTAEDAAHVAYVLEQVCPNDPWVAARASELHAVAGDAEAAESCSHRALSAVPDASARSDFWRRWSQTLARLPAPATPRLLRSVDLALRLGETDRALEFARCAAAKDGDAFDVMLALGRAAMARGDLATAGIALEKALVRAPSEAASARASVEIAEVRYISGDLHDARTHAELALSKADDFDTRLSARNILGKLELATAEWAKAEQHFAADACEAACVGDVVGELRARLNRAIALMSSGRRDEARAMLVSVLDDGNHHGELRATSFALANLATIAILAHDYPEALRLSEQAIDVRRRIGEKIGLSRLITNLAALRVRLGLVDEAEQALAFGRKACGPSMPGARLAHVSLVAARVHLARGRTHEARADVMTAIGCAGRSTDGGTRGECYRFLARIALEDGDIARANDALAQAEQEAKAADSQAEIAVLSAARSRAAGEDFAPGALIALELAREADDLELIREARILLHHAAVMERDDVGARMHLEAAVLVRDRIAGSLPEGLRASYLVRRDLAELARLEAASVAASSTTPPDFEPEGRTGVRERASSRAVLAASRKLIGEDPAMLSLVAAIRKVGPSDATVLVHGESGTGKELVAEAIHAASDRRSGPLVKVNCAALVETLLLSELFGHEKGAFTGAAARRRGRFELAEGGTLFLDEIGDISPRTQVALLRVLQERTFERVGGTAPIHANVRIVCATHRDLRGMVARGEFREDLYYRLRGVVLEVPALRQRLRDLPLIASAILSRIAAERKEPGKSISARAIEGLGRHAWPGNVRELENALRAATLFSESDAVELEDFTENVEGLSGIDSEPQTMRVPRLGTRGAYDDVESSSMLTPSASAPPALSGVDGGPSSQTPTEVAYAHVRSGTSLSDLKRQIEHDCIAKALAESQGNITRAAGLLGMKRPRLSQLVKQYGLGNGSEES